MRERNISVDVLKCLAALLITNSHMAIMYGKYSFLATGGCIGDVLFFFCSGFTLFLKPLGGASDFPNWYKRRINRIYPSVLAVAIIGCLFFGYHGDILDVITAGKYWFVTCIMLYYIAIFFVGIYLRGRLFWVGALVLLGSAAWFYTMCREPGFTLYGHKYDGGVNYVRWLLFFIFMLMGAWMGAQPREHFKCRPVRDLVLLLCSIIAFYVIFISTMRVKSITPLQILSVFPLMGVVFYFYKVGQSEWVRSIYNSKAGFFFIRFVGGLCLEIYMIQYYLFTDKLNNIFPLNILIMFAVIIGAAYLTRCFARLIGQTFKDEPYDWKKIREIY